MAIFARRNYGWAEQDINALLDYSEDWADFIIGSDTITQSVWTVDSPSVVLSSEVIAGVITTVWVTGGIAGASYRIINSIVTAQGRRDVRFFMLTITDVASAPVKPVTSALFSRFATVNNFKTESLAFLDKSFPVTDLSDDYIWDNLLAAEAELQTNLRVFFVPTVIIPDDAPQSEVDALKLSGVSFAQETAYDYDPSTWTSGSWGSLQLRNVAIIRIDSVEFNYPSPTLNVFTLPMGWVRLDHKTGFVRFVPSGQTMSYGSVSSFMMSAIGSGRTIPNMIHIRYVCGLEDVKTKWPQIASLVKRMAIMRILKNAFLPQSSSISADGLSQSVSVDTAKWQGDIDGEVENLRQAIHGIRIMVI